jgi:Zn-dependent protease/predicted transcriptional regulator
MGTRIGRLFGIEIRVNLGWIIVLGLIGYLALMELQLAEPALDPVLGWVLGGLVALAFFVSSTAHDLAHALMARRRGMAVPSLAISFFGGATPLDPVPTKPADDLAIAVSGPLTSIGIGAVLAAVAAGLDAIGGPVLTLAAETLFVIVVLNFILGFVNLIPAYPLDGGRIIRALGWRRGGSIDAGWRAAARAGRLVGFAVVVLGVVMIASGPIANGAMTMLAGWFLVLSARSIGDRSRVNRLIGGLHVQDAMETSPVSIGPTLTVDTFADQLLDAESEMTAVPVVSDGNFVGILGARQVGRLQRRLWATTRVEDVMAKPPRLPILSALDSLDTAVERLYRTGLDGVPVMDGSTLVGILTRRSVGKLVHERGLATGEVRPPA